MVVFTGIGLSMAAIPNLIVLAVPPEMTGQATGVNALVRSIGSSLGSRSSPRFWPPASPPPTRSPPTTRSPRPSGWAPRAALLAAIAASLVPRSRKSAAEPLSPGDSAASTVPYDQGTRT